MSIKKNYTENFERLSELQREWILKTAAVVKGGPCAAFIDVELGVNCVAVHPGIMRSLSAADRKQVAETVLNVLFDNVGFTVGVFSYVDGVIVYDDDTPKKMVAKGVESIAFADIAFVGSEVFGAVLKNVSGYSGEALNQLCALYKYEFPFTFRK